MLRSCVTKAENEAALIHDEAKKSHIGESRNIPRAQRGAAGARLREVNCQQQRGDKFGAKGDKREGADASEGNLADYIVHGPNGKDGGEPHGQQQRTGAARGEYAGRRFMRSSGEAQLFENLAALGERFDSVEARLVANSGRGRHANGSVRRHFHFGIDDIFGPIATAGGNVAGQRKILERRHGNVVRAADAGFEHAAAPDVNGILLAKIVNAASGSVSADAAEFDIDDFAGADFNGGARVLDIVNAFVEANWSFDLALKSGVGKDVVPAERLLDHDEVEGVELLQKGRVFEAISGVGVGHQADAREALAERADRLDIAARLDFDLDALVAGRERFFHFCN